jgi:outer membrane immunogenic protein
MAVFVRLVGAFALLAGSTAVAFADGYSPGADSPAIAAYDWTGVYVGGSVGAGRQSLDWRFTNPTPPSCCAPFSASESEGVYGGHVGAQIQFGHIVVGAELGDIWSFDGSFAGKTGCVGTSPGFTCEAKIRSGILTAGPRLGWAVDNWLLYGTGGYAEGGVFSKGVAANGTVFDYSRTHYRDGWFAGGGVEYALAKNIIFGVEYQHIDLATTFHASSADSFAPSPPGVNGRDIGASEDIVRARLSFKIGPSDWRSPTR